MLAVIIIGSERPHNGAWHGLINERFYPKTVWKEKIKEKQIDLSEEDCQRRETETKTLF